MEPVRVDPLTGVINFFQSMASGHFGPLEGLEYIEVGKQIISTTLPSDTKIWETGIHRGEWVIVEQYPDKSHAEEGHQKWAKLLAEMPDFPIKDIDLWNLGQEEAK
uniref:Uncharacterized protein n=1 Tax=viral metagenome TaxID=1070528 RepID=A0A6M3M3I8_9ZZZZ